jgi:hypothetical protein
MDYGAHYEEAHQVIAAAKSALEAQLAMQEEQPESRILLRPAERGDEEEDVLLRPAKGDDTAATLLRPSGQEPESGEIEKPLYVRPRRDDDDG